MTQGGEPDTTTKSVLVVRLALKPRAVVHPEHLGDPLVGLPDGSVAGIDDAICKSRPS